MGRYLGLLYTPFGQDIDKVNFNGHSMLHFLACKRDEAANTWEIVLAIRSVLGKGLACLDFVNGVAIFC